MNRTGREEAPATAYQRNLKDSPTFSLHSISKKWVQLIISKKGMIGQRVGKMRDLSRWMKEAGERELTYDRSDWED